MEGRALAAQVRSTRALLWAAVVSLAVSVAMLLWGAEEDEFVFRAGFLFLVPSLGLAIFAAIRLRGLLWELQSNRASQASMSDSDRGSEGRASARATLGWRKVSGAGVPTLVAVAQAALVIPFVLNASMPRDEEWLVTLAPLGLLLLLGAVSAATAWVLWYSQAGPTWAGRARRVSVLALASLLIPAVGLPLAQYRAEVAEELEEEIRSYLQDAVANVTGADAPQQPLRAPPGELAGTPSFGDRSGSLGYPLRTQPEAGNPVRPAKAAPPPGSPGEENPYEGLAESGFFDYLVGVPEGLLARTYSESETYRRRTTASFLAWTRAQKRLDLRNAAEVLSLSTLTGDPAEYVADHLDEVRQQVKKRDLIRLLQENQWIEQVLLGKHGDLGAGRRVTP